MFIYFYTRIVFKRMCGRKYPTTHRISNPHRRTSEYVALQYIRNPHNNMVRTTIISTIVIISTSLKLTPFLIFINSLLMKIGYFYGKTCIF